MSVWSYYRFLGWSVDLVVGWIDQVGFFWYYLATMSQDKLIRLVSKGDKDGVGKNDVYYTRYNNKNKKDPSAKLSMRKYNKKTRKHETYTQKK